MASDSAALCLSLDLSRFHQGRYCWIGCAEDGDVGHREQPQEQDRPDREAEADDQEGLRTGSGLFG